MKKKISIFLALISIVLWANPPFKMEKQNVNCHAVPFDYEYKYIASNIGDRVRIGEVEYIMVAVPFIEHATGDAYYIQYPQEVKKVASIGINVDYKLGDDSCYSDMFSNFPVKYDTFSYKTFYKRANIYSIDDDFDYYGSTQKTTLTISQKVNVTAHVKINKTIVNIDVSFILKKIQRNAIADNDVNLIDNIDWEKVGYNLLLIENLKKILNYTKIIKVEK